MAGAGGSWSKDCPGRIGGGLYTLTMVVSRMLTVIHTTAASSGNCGESQLDVILHKCCQAMVFAVSLARECEAWKFHGGVVLWVSWNSTTLTLVEEVRRSRTSSLGA